MKREKGKVIFNVSLSETSREEEKEEEERNESSYNYRSTTRHDKSSVKGILSIHMDTRITQ